ncbi:MAG: 4Fe-4S binding protein [Phycisphaerales bacterium]|nr:4Fe-4S binding protein [Phycisphaerales bacterium]
MPRKSKQVARVRSDGTVSLRICREPTGKPKTPRRSRMGYWRAGVLIAVHVGIIAHIIWWLAVGKTISPVEPSESMQTLEQGVINAGFVFFALALLATLLLGRYVCGWACHVIALQDLCLYLLKKVGIRPKPFRSRLLMLVPLGLALYMFVWPSFKREVLYPTMETAGIERPMWMKPVAPFDGFESDFVIDDFWATFPAWYMVAPFLFVIGFASVYFLGAKGFCTYGCPYGGLFVLADRVSPTRVRVTDACEGCGQCTAACTSNVRVHEEVRDYGKVIDPGCMKTMDCVAVCPNQALYIGLGAPAVFSRRRDGARNRSRGTARARLFDVSLAEELLIAGVFLLLFVCYRQMAGSVPMLMAVGMAGIGAFCAWVLIRMARDANVRIQPWQLKLRGRLRPAGLLFMLLCLIGAAGAAWSGAVRWQRWQADLLHAQVQVPASLALRPEFAPSATERKRARRSLSRYEITDAPSRGGFGWNLNADELVRVAFLSLVLGDLERADGALRQVIHAGKPTDSLVFELAEIIRARGGGQVQVDQAMQAALARHEHLHAVRRELAVQAAAGEGVPAGERLWDQAPETARDDPWFWIERARYWGAIGGNSRAADALDAAMTRITPGRRSQAAAAIESAEIAGALGDIARAGRLTDLAIAADPRDPGLQLRLAALLLQMGRNDDGLRTLAAAQASPRAGVGVLLSASQIRDRLAHPGEAENLLRRAESKARTNPWELLQVGAAWAVRGMGLRDDRSTQRGLQLIEQASSLNPDSPWLLAQRAAAMANLQRFDDAAAVMARAAELGSNNAVLAFRAAELYRHAGDQAQATRWQDEAVRRGGADEARP